MGLPSRRRWRKLAAATIAVLVMVAGCTAAPTAPAAGPSSAAAAPEHPVLPWEGGPAYYGAYPAMRDAGWTDPSFFPIGAWFHAVIAQSDVSLDKSVGINTYVELADYSDMSIVRSNGMFAITNGARKGTGSETVGWLLDDETDMYAGAGSEPWTGKSPGQGQICQAVELRCGYTVMEARKNAQPEDGRALYANYGKGVFMWQSAEDAAQFVNKYVDVVSDDIYWYTDPGICNEALTNAGIRADQCRLAANYGAVIDRMRMLDGLDGKRQPIWAFVETGQPFPNGGKITGDQVAGAAMNSIVHGARGIIYFNLSYDQSCKTWVLRDPCGAAVVPSVERVNRQITQLAPVLNTQSFDLPLGPGLDTMVKEYRGSYYVFSMLGRGAPPGKVTLNLPPWVAVSSTAEVMFENRTVPISKDGELTDSLDAEYSYHVYKVTPA
jgi:hypothetical protein